MRHALSTGRLVLAAAVMVGAQVPATASAGFRRLRSIFHIEKSENRNQVHYDLRVDAQCRPAPKDQVPLVAYWQMREEGPNASEPLTSLEQRAYGIEEDSIEVTRSTEGGRVRFALRAMPDRPLSIAIHREGQRCRAHAYTQIDGKKAKLASVYVEVGMLSAEYLLLRGQAHSGAAVQEKVTAD